jgi:hypothetical protein
MAEASNSGSVDELDEFGLPKWWRRDEIEVAFLDSYPNQWKQFVDWCESHGYRAFPASVETVLRFLLHGPLRGRELYRGWVAIARHHAAYYWNSNANPQLLLKLGGAEVTGDGVVRVPRKILEEFGLSE